jgi:hypothetical protein
MRDATAKLMLNLRGSVARGKGASCLQGTCANGAEKDGGDRQDEG